MICKKLYTIIDGKLKEIQLFVNADVGNITLECMSKEDYENIEPFDEKEEKKKDKFNINVLKQYFNFKKSIEKIKIAVTALDDLFNNHDFDGYWIDRDIKVGSEHEGDIFCGFYLDIDKDWFKKLLEDYGFVLEDDEDGFWITGVKE